MGSRRQQFLGFCPFGNGVPKGQSVSLEGPCGVLNKAKNKNVNPRQFLIGILTGLRSLLRGIPAFYVTRRSCIHSHKAEREKVKKCVCAYIYSLYF